MVAVLLALPLLPIRQPMYMAMYQGLKRVARQAPPEVEQLVAAQAALLLSEQSTLAPQFAIWALQSRGYSRRQTKKTAASAPAPHLPH